MKTLLLALVITMVSTSTGAMSYAQLRKDKATGGNLWLFDLVYVKGLGQGYLIANGVLKERDSKPLYCQPGALALNEENYVDFIEKTADKLRAAGVNRDDDKFGVEEMLMIGLQTTFPCSQK